MNIHDSPPLCPCPAGIWQHCHLQQLPYLHMPYALKYLSYTFGVAVVELDSE